MSVALLQGFGTGVQASAARRMGEQRGAMCRRFEWCRAPRFTRWVPVGLRVVVACSILFSIP